MSGPFLALRVPCQLWATQNKQTMGGERLQEPKAALDPQLQEASASACFQRLSQLSEATGPLARPVGVCVGRVQVGLPGSLCRGAWRQGAKDAPNSPAGLLGCVRGSDEHSPALPQGPPNSYLARGCCWPFALLCNLLPMWLCLCFLICTQETAILPRAVGTLC